MNKIEIKEWNVNLDLTEFYDRAADKGFVNNQSQKTMIDCFRNEKEWNAWILYKNDKPIGSVAAHSFDEVMGENSYRILARTCVLEGVRSKGLMTAKTAIKQHQNFTDQFFMPTCIDWVGQKGTIYATSNANKEASQSLVHRIYFPALEDIGIVQKCKEDVIYRNTKQTVWKIFPDRFFESLEKYPKWM